MLIRDQLKADATTALKNREDRKTQVLRFLISLIDKRGLQLPPGEMTEEEVLSVLQKEMKNKRESKEMFEKASRNDLVAEVDEEIKILSSYLPAVVSEDEIRKAVINVVEKSGNNFGMVMKEMVAQYRGRVDGAVMSRIVKEVLSG